MRHLPTVIDCLIAVIPKHIDHIQLIQSLHSVKQSSMFGSPEIQYEYWNELASILQYHIPNPSELWELNVKSIFNGSETI
jgi:hypothetical protein